MLEINVNRLDKIARRSKRVGGAIVDLWGPKKIAPVSHGKKMKMLLLFRFFFTRRGVLEINRLDEIARRSKRVGGAIADLWGSHLVGTY